VSLGLSVVQERKAEVVLFSYRWMEEGWLEVRCCSPHLVSEVAELVGVDYLKVVVAEEGFVASWATGEWVPWVVTVVAKRFQAVAEGQRHHVVKFQWPSSLTRMEVQVFAAVPEVFVVRKVVMVNGVEAKMPIFQDCYSFQRFWTEISAA